MEILRQTRPTTVTKETKNHLATKNQDGMKLGDDKLMTPKDESESKKKCDNMEKVGIRPSGNTSLGRNNRKKGANISDRMNNEREPEHDKQDMDPPGLTESEDEEESEEETEDEHHSSCLPTPRPTMTLTKASYTSSDSSDEETQELRIYKEMKSKLHRSKVKHFFHPPGRASVKKIKQQAMLDEEGNSHKEEKSEDVAKNTGRAPKEVLSGRHRFRDHGIILPKLIESDEDNETEDEEEDLNEKSEHGIDSRTVPQNTSATLRYGRPAGEEKDERDTVNRYNINFSIFQSPKNAIEGDILVFPYSNLWFQGRLACRFDKLEDARRSDWKTNRFKVDEIRATDDLNNSGHLPTTALFNLSYDTDWILGIHGDQQNEDDRSRIIIGCYEIQKINLASINESVAVYQKFEVNLLSPGRRLSGINSMESEGMMFRSLQQRAATDTGCMLQGTETAELAIITEDSVIRRIYLNNRTIPIVSAKLIFDAVAPK